jgi:predicted component of type VI protein secretion system
MTASQLIAFSIAPLTLLTLGWAVALAVGWKDRHQPHLELTAPQEAQEELMRLDEGVKDMVRRAERLSKLKTLIERLEPTKDAPTRERQSQ